MSVSRIHGLLKRNIPKINNHVRRINWAAGGHDEPWHYRTMGLSHLSKGTYLIGDTILGLTVWWILWHLWHEPGHIIGEFPYPDPSQWTDAELGIPPDDGD